MTVTSAAVATTKFLFSMCTVVSDAGTGDILLVLGVSHVCGHAHVR